MSKVFVFLSVLFRMNDPLSQVPSSLVDRSKQNNSLWIEMNRHKGQSRAVDLSGRLKLKTIN